MRIDSLSPLMARSLLAALPKVVPGFAAGMKDVAPDQAHIPDPATAHPTTSVAMLVTLAAADPQMERRRKLAADAERGVAVLDKLHKELVAGTPSVERLQEIVEWSENFEAQDDPVLAQILSDIDLRVRVELAKIDVQA